MFTSYLMSNPCRMNVRSFKTLPHIAMGLNASQLHRILPSGMFDAFSTTTSACPPRLSKHRGLYMSHDMEGWSTTSFTLCLHHFQCARQVTQLHGYTHLLSTWCWKIPPNFMYQDIPWHVTKHHPWSNAWLQSGSPFQPPNWHLHWSTNDSTPGFPGSQPDLSNQDRSPCLDHLGAFMNVIWVIC